MVSFAEVDEKWTEAVAENFERMNLHRKVVMAILQVLLSVALAGVGL